VNDLPSPAHATTASVDLSVIRFHINLSRRYVYGSWVGFRVAASER